MLPYGKQQIDQDEIEAITRVLRSDWLTTGPAVDRFEEDLATATGSTHAVAACNGTAALHMAMQALEIGPGDEVIVPAITFVATANAVLYQGGCPVFADVAADTLLIDPEDVEKKITIRTRAIVAVDYAGQPCDYRRLREIANRHGLALVADACHSLGGQYAGKKVGSLADLNCFSFHPVKPITTGEGGAVTTCSADYAGRMRKFRNHGLDSDFRQRAVSGRHAYAMLDLGFNYRLTDIQAAIGSCQLQKLERFTQQRQWLADCYAQHLSRSDLGFLPLARAEDRDSAWHLFVVRCQSAQKICRDGAYEHLRRSKIGCNVHYQPVYQHPFYSETLGYPQDTCPVANAAYQEILTLPLFPAMTEADVAFVCDALQRFPRNEQGKSQAA